MENDTTELGRSRALGALDLLDTPPEEEFDALAALAAEMLGCPMGMVTLIDDDRQWVKAAFGSTLKETTREAAFCDYTVRGGGRFVIEDTHADPRFAVNPFVATPRGVRFYAGHAISSVDPATGEAVPVGAVCAVDHAPRTLDADAERALGHLAMLADALLRARRIAAAARETADACERQAVDLTRKDRNFRQAERLAAIGSWRLTLADDSIEWSDGVFRIYEIDRDDPVGLANALDHYPPHARATVTAALAKTIETGAPFDVEVDFVTAKGRQRRVRSLGELELADGRPQAVIGVFQDVTDRYLAEQSLRRSASIDENTRIANRGGFNAELELAMDRSRRDGTPLALLLVDLDHFKGINDRHGHMTGDDVLRAFARRLRRVHPGGFAARLGGDEFALILPGLVRAEIDATAHRLLDDLKAPVHTTAGIIRASGTIGIAELSSPDESMRDFVHRADVALYHAKRRERGSIASWGELRSADRRAA